MVDEPILIMAMPRSGSSMTAGIFAAHGVWTGPCRAGSGRNPKGFFEGLAIKQALMEMHKAIVHKGVLAEPTPGFRALVEGLIVKDGYKGGPWLWKGSALYWPAWFEFEPKIVVCRRNLEATFRSARSAPKVFGHNLSDHQLRDNIAFHHAQLDYLIAERGAVEVETEAVAHREYATIKRAIEHCGLVFDEKATDDFVEPDYWHYGSAQHTG